MAEDTSEGAGGKLDGWRGAGRGKGTGTGAESAGIDAVPGDRRWMTSSCSCDGGLFLSFQQGCNEAVLDSPLGEQGGGASEGG